MVCSILHGLTTGSLIIFVNFFKLRLLQINIWNSYHDQRWGSIQLKTCEICELYTLDKLTVMFLVVCSLCTIIAFIPLTAGIIHLGICLGQGKGLRVVWVHSLIKKSRTLSRTLYTCSLCSRLVHSLLKLSIYIISHHHNQPEVAYAMVLP